MNGNSNGKGYVQMKGLALACLLFFGEQAIQAQNEAGIYLPFASTVSFSNSLSPDEIKKAVLHQIRNEEPKRWHEDFANELSQLPAYMIRNGLTYQNRNECTRLIENTIKELTRSNGDSTIYQVLVMKDASFNAFAMEGGIIMVNMGFLAALQNEDELAMVLAHEMGHVSHHHGYQGYVRMRQAQNKASAASLIGSLIGPGGSLIYLASKFFLINSIFEHSRQNEAEADAYGQNLMVQSNYAIQPGAEVFRRFHLLHEKYELTEGKEIGSVLFGSTHPEPLERYELMKSSFDGDSIAKSASTAFLKLRTEARIDQLELLLNEHNYRVLIETGWGYLIDRPEEIEVKEIMFKAAYRLKMLEPDRFKNNYILTESYFMDESVRDEINASDTISDETRKTIQTILLHPRRISESPFAINATFQVLYDQLYGELTVKSNREAKLWVAIGTPNPDRAMLQAYIDEGGKYQQAAAYYLGQSQPTLNRSVLLPNFLEINAGSAGKMDYRSCFSFYNWSEVTTLFAKYYSQPVLLNRYDRGKISMEESSLLEGLPSLLSYDSEVGTMSFDIMRFDPALAEFMIRNQVKTLVSFDCFESYDYTHTQIQEFDVSFNPKIKRTVGGRVSIDTYNEGYMATMFNRGIKNHAKAFKE